MRTDPPCLTAALDYLARGWSAIALQPRQKKPIGSWEGFQTRLISEKALRLIWKREPEANVGIALGPVSGLIGIDIDGPEGLEKFAELAAIWGAKDDPGCKTDTVAFRTGAGGGRLLYSLPRGADPAQHVVRDGKKEILRFQAKGGQTVMPPSIHPNGEEYGWRIGFDPESVNVAPCPEWILHYLADPEGRPGSGIKEEPKEVSVIERARAYCLACDPAISGSGGHGQTFKVACKLVQGFGLSTDEAYAIMAAEYNPRCCPPWKPSELKHKVESAALVGASPDLTEAPKKAKAGPGPAVTMPLPRPAPKDKTPATINLKRVDKIEQKEVEWLWPGYLPLGKVAVLDGDPGLGKSTLLLEIAAAVSGRGEGLLFVDKEQSHRCVTGQVVLLSAEDSEEDTIKPRLLAARAHEDPDSLPIVGDR